MGFWTENDKKCAAKLKLKIYVTRIIARRGTPKFVVIGEVVVRVVHRDLQTFESGQDLH
jgi:hypothetical protein